MKKLNKTVAGLSLILSSLVGAQTPILKMDGQNADDYYGSSAKIIGDVNGDGHADMIIGAPENDAGGTNSGCAQIRSGANGAVLFTFVGNAGEKLGFSVDGAGDINGDNVPDVIVGAPLADPNGALSGRAVVYSGADGSVIYTFDGWVAGGQQGFSVAGCGDTNNDGRDDVIVGAPLRSSFGSMHHGMAFVFSGMDGSLLRLVSGDFAGDNGGYAVAGAGDANGDGYDDILLGAPNGSAQGYAQNSGWIKVISGFNGLLIRQVGGTNTGDRFGHSVAPAGDIDGDGLADVIAGAPNFNSMQGCAMVLDGLHGTVLYTKVGQPGEQFAKSVGGGADINGDGRDDFLAAAREEAQGRILVYSGLDGSVLMELANGLVGDNAATGGDIDNDGYADVLSGNPYDHPNGPFSGSATVYSGITSLESLYAGTNEDLSLRIGVDGPADAKSVQFAQSGLPFAVEVDSPLGTFTAERCILAIQGFATNGAVPSFPGVPTLHVDPAAMLIVFDAPLPAAGLNFPSTTPSGLAGTSIIAQAVALSPMAQNGTYAASDAQVIRFLP